METTVKWIDHMSFVAETGSGHMLTMDGPPEHGGRNLAARPMELLLAGMGGCTAFDVIQILKKARQPSTAAKSASKLTARMPYLPYLQEFASDSSFVEEVSPKHR